MIQISIYFSSSDKMWKNVNEMDEFFILNKEYKKIQSSHEFGKIVSNYNSTRDSKI